MTASDQKRSAAEAALEYIEPGVVLGVGTGSTVNFLIEMLPQVRDRIDRCVSSSKASTKATARTTASKSRRSMTVGDIDVYIDGADEATKRLHLIKGGGGALTREKILAGAARRFVCIVDQSKLVGMLGTFPLPVEVLPMAQGFVARKFLQLRAQPIWRENFVTDNGNHILDIHDLSISNPIEMENRLNQVPGILSRGYICATCCRHSADRRRFGRAGTQGLNHTIGATVRGMPGGLNDSRAGVSGRAARSRLVPECADIGVFRLECR